MKKFALLTLAATLCLSSLSAKEKSFPAVQQVVNLIDLSSDFINEFVIGLHPDIAISCTQGTTLPLSFLHSWGLLSLKCAPDLAVTIERPFYLRVVGSKPYISQDLVIWEKAEKAFEGKQDVNVKIDAQSGISVESSTTSSW
jgi:hypothetical protein